MRKIKAHKGGRGAQAPHARMSDADKQLLLGILEIRKMSMADWIVEKLYQDWEAFKQERNPTSFAADDGDSPIKPADTSE